MNGNTNSHEASGPMLRLYLDSIAPVNNKGEPTNCRSNVQPGPMIHHSFDYSEILEFYAWR